MGWCSDDAVICLPADGDAAVSVLLRLGKKMIQRSGKFTYAKIILLPAREMMGSSQLSQSVFNNIEHVPTANRNKIKRF